MKNVFLFLIIIITLFSSCTASTSTDTSITDSNLCSSHESNEISNDASQKESSDTSDQEQMAVKDFFADEKVIEVECDSGTFLVKQTKHTYRDSDLILLYIENQSSKDYSVTINGKYLDVSGETMQTETQTFDQFYSGYQNYFIFYPNSTFSKFEYTLSFGDVKKLSNNDPKSYDKDIRVTDFEYKFLRLEKGKDVIRKLLVENDDHTMYPSIIAYITYSNLTEFVRTPYLDIILYNQKGEVVSIFSRAPYISGGQSFGNGEPFPIYQTTEETVVWPEKYLGEISAIVCVRSIDTYPNLQQHTPERFTTDGLGTEYDFAE